MFAILPSTGLPSPPCRILAKSVTGTVQLGVLDNGHVLFVHSVGYAGSPHAFADVGLRRSLHATASGKIFLAAMPWAEVEKIMSAHCDRYTDRTITSLPRMKQEIAEIQRKNYALNVEELLAGYWVLAAPVIGRDGRTLAAISLTLSTEHFSPDQERALRCSRKRSRTQVFPAARQPWTGPVETVKPGKRLTGCD